MRYYKGDIVELFKGHRTGTRYRVIEHNADRILIEHPKVLIHFEAHELFLHHRPWTNHLKALVNYFK